MTKFEKFLKSLTTKSIPILDQSIEMESYTPIDLSTSNPDIFTIDLTNPNTCQYYIDTVLKQKNAKVAYGGYLEKRSIYSDKSSFSGNVNALRNIHIGIDYWAPANTKVIVPLDGVVHSFANNATSGDYGPTIILAHTILNITFYTLYGHLSLNSIEDLYIGQNLKQKDILGYLGTSDINVNYAPHLHFQIIKEIGDYNGDFPGVCSEQDLPYYSQNCPNPNLLLKI